MSILFTNFCQLNGISYHFVSNSVELDVDFAFWMQKDFVEGSTEISTIKILFPNVTEYDCPNNINFEQYSLFGI